MEATLKHTLDRMRAFASVYASEIDVWTKGVKPKLRGIGPMASDAVKVMQRVQLVELLSLSLLLILSVCSTSHITP